MVFGGKVCMGPPFAVFWGGGVGLRGLQCLGGLEGWSRGDAWRILRPEAGTRLWGRRAPAWSLGPDSPGLAGVRWVSNSPWVGLGLLLAPASANRHRACRPSAHPRPARGPARHFSIFHARLLG